MTWLNEKECKQLFPNALEGCGIFIKNAAVVDPISYLQGLWSSCEKKGAVLYKEKIRDLKGLENEYDHVIIALGAATNQIQECADLPITPVKGQILEIKSISLPVPLNSNIYVVKNIGKDSCIVGSTFERDFSNEEPDLEKAKKEILPKAFELHPEISQEQILDCRAGVRASAPNHLPFIKQLSSKSWVITGFASKGLLYHALYAKKLAAELIK